MHAFGPKVISWLEPPDDPALNSRCILVPMFETKSPDLVNLENAEVKQVADQLRRQLLAYRLHNLRRTRVTPVPGDDALRPRNADLLRVLAAATANEGGRSEKLLQFFISSEVVPAEPLSPEQNVMLRVLFLMAHCRKKEFDSILISELTDSVNSILRIEKQHFRLEPRKVGSVLTSMGFCDRKRTNSGWTVRLGSRDMEKIHQLAARYGIGLDSKYSRYRGRGSHTSAGSVNSLV